MAPDEAGPRRVVWGYHPPGTPEKFPLLVQPSSKGCTAARRSNFFRDRKHHPKLRRPPSPLVQCLPGGPPRPTRGYGRRCPTRAPTAGLPRVRVGRHTGGRTSAPASPGCWAGRLRAGIQASWPAALAPVICASDPVSPAACSRTALQARGPAGIGRWPARVVAERDRRVGPPAGSSRSLWMPCGCA